MKKLLILVFFLPVVLSSQTLVSTLPENKKIVLEEYTGFHCGNCPAGHLLAQQIYDNNPGNGSYTSLADCQSNCIVNSILLEKSNTKKELIKVMDLLGRETKQTNQPLLYLYDDGTVEKRIIIE